MQDSPAVKAAVAASGLVIIEDQPPKKSLEDILLPPVAYMPKFGNKKVHKQMVYKVRLASDHKNQKSQGMRKGKGKAPLTPAIIEVSNEEDLFGDSLLDEEIAESTRIQPSSTITSSRKGGKKAISKTMNWRLSTPLHGMTNMTKGKCLIQHLIEYMLTALISQITM